MLNVLESNPELHAFNNDPLKLRVRRLALTAIPILTGMKLGTEVVQVVAGDDYQLLPMISNTGLILGTATLRGVQEAIYPLTSRHSQPKTEEYGASDSSNSRTSNMTEEPNSAFTSNPDHVMAAQACMKDGEFEAVKDYFVDTELVQISELGVDEPTEKLLTYPTPENT